MNNSRRKYSALFFINFVRTVPRKMKTMRKYWMACVKAIRSFIFDLIHLHLFLIPNVVIDQVSVAKITR